MIDDLPTSRAGEYVLGTLPTAERERFETDLALDAALRREVSLWERRFSPLADAIRPEEPPASLWAAIERMLDARGQRSPDADALVITGLRRSLGFWRGVAAGTGAMAAVLAAALALVALLRAPPAASEARDYVAVVDRGGELPALIVHVDLGRASVRIRALNTETAAGRSLELWYVGEGGKPTSLGVVSRASERRALPAAINAGTLDGSRIAVSTEPKGGSPTGSPTGPVIYSGTLVKAEP